MTRRALGLLALALLAGHALAAQSVVRGETRGVLITLDGAGAGVIDDAVRRGLMPNLQRLRALGAVARGSQPPLPVKTAAAHAALFTGAWGDTNGITGNSMPRPGGTLGELDSGFTSQHLLAEPIWVTAARQGLDATVVTATQNYPFEPFFDGRRFGGSYGAHLSMLDGFQGIQAPDRVLHAADLEPRVPAPAERLPVHVGDVRACAFHVAGARVEALLFDDPEDPQVGFDTLALASGTSSTRLKPLGTGADPGAFGVLRLSLAAGEAGLFLRLFELSADGRELLLYHTSPAVLRASRPELQALALQATDGFVPGTANQPYERGELGAPLWAGGDGTAEARLLETVALCIRQFRRLTELALDRSANKLVVTYLPVPDEFSHLWLGLLDPALPGHDRALAARLRPYFDRGLGLIDAHVGFLLSKADAHTFVAVAADHGQTTINRVLRPNVALRDAGLLVLDETGGVDLKRTRAAYFAGNTGYVLVNRPARGGQVPPGQERGVRRAVSRALLALRDPKTGQRLVRAVLDASRGPGPFGMGGPHGGDLYLSLAAGLDLEPSTRGALVEAVRPAGTHVCDPQRPELQATFQVAGAGVAPGVDLGVIRHIDVAPTLCALLGLDPPAEARGHVLVTALAQRAARAPLLGAAQ